MFGGFQVGAFQTNYQQEGAIVAPQPGGGGFWYAYDREQVRRTRRKRDLEEEAQAAKALQDQVEAEIAGLLLEQEQVDVEAEEFQRLQALADTYAGTTETSERVSAAMAAAREKKTRGALEALQREISRMQEEEEMALLLLLND